MTPDDEEDPQIDPEALERQRLFGERLRALFAEVIEEEVPDDLANLLNRLDAQGDGG